LNSFKELSMNSIKSGGTGWVLSNFEKYIGINSERFDNILFASSNSFLISLNREY